MKIFTGTPATDIAVGDILILGGPCKIILPLNKE